MTKGGAGGEATALRPRFPGLLGASAAAGAVSILASWVFVLALDRQQVNAFVSLETARRAAAFLGELVGSGSGRVSAFADPSEWKRAAGLAHDTLAMSVLAVALAGAGALATFMLGAQNVMAGQLAPEARGPALVAFVLVRASWAFVRGVPELVWALIVVFVFSPGILAGAVALGVHYYGVLGRLGSEVVGHGRPAGAGATCRWRRQGADAPLRRLPR